MAWRWFEHPDGDALASACARTLDDAATDALQQRGRAQFALAGGRTPLPAYRKWAADSAPDARVDLVPTDERWVPADHAANNLSQLRACFPADGGPTWHALVPAHPGLNPELAQARESLAQLGTPWDLVLLGMGEDGHFASLFPGDPELTTALDPASSIEAVIGRPDPMPPEAPFPRISLSLACLLRSRRLLLVVSGSRKRDLLLRAQQQPDSQHWPVSALLHARGATVEIHWSS